ncbi:hypothetical protein D7V93_24145 [Corallococcus llansteffanensis]|uniref:Uncharacterized protein n=1 Tax=Corallococcus llansteffanensis TaxID=2316731 RepID=A0A3A8PU45_9BACT|nr:hypothetical protein D7V93_24145 [Corallococcus llansteffanensis]
MSSAAEVSDWASRHRKSLLVGSLVVIAGVVFVVVSAGAGLVVLAPTLLLTMYPGEPVHPLAETLP